jgi:hypothetical protein
MPVAEELLYPNGCTAYQICSCTYGCGRWASVANSCQQLDSPWMDKQHTKKTKKRKKNVGCVPLSTTANMWCHS